VCLADFVLFSFVILPLIELAFSIPISYWANMAIALVGAVIFEVWTQVAEKAGEERIGLQFFT
jgi:hypothetical protein